MMTFGDELARACIARKWTHGELARRSGYDRSTITRWINESRSPERENVEVLCRVLRATPEEEARLFLSVWCIPEDEQIRTQVMDWLRLPEAVRDHLVAAANAIAA